MSGQNLFAVQDDLLGNGNTYGGQVPIQWFTMPTGQQNKAFINALLISSTDISFPSSNTTSINEDVGTGTLTAYPVNFRQVADHVITIDAEIVFVADPLSHYERLFPVENGPSPIEDRKSVV